VELSGIIYRLCCRMDELLEDDDHRLLEGEEETLEYEVTLIDPICPYFTIGPLYY
jgi:hypothetical protein